MTVWAGQSTYSLLRNREVSEHVWWCLCGTDSGEPRTFALKITLGPEWNYFPLGVIIPEENAECGEIVKFYFKSSVKQIFQNPTIYPGNSIALPHLDLAFFQNRLFSFFLSLMRTVLDDIASHHILLMYFMSRFQCKEIGLVKENEKKYLLRKLFDTFHMHYLMHFQFKSGKCVKFYAYTSNRCPL